MTTFGSLFFHEAGHVLLHGKKEIFIEDVCQWSVQAQPRARQDYSRLVSHPGPGKGHKRSPAALVGHARGNHPRVLQLQPRQQVELGEG